VVALGAGVTDHPYAVRVSPVPDLSLAESVVLAIVDEAPIHGFGVAALVSREGAIGRVWQIPKPVVYRALGRLDEAGLVAVGPEEPGRGPTRRPYAVTDAGRAQVAEWLALPVEHVRDVRSELLVKLALLDRRGSSAIPLLTAQREAFAPIVDGLTRRPDAGPAGFDHTLATWRRANAEAAVAFIDALLE
jgi:DNA-binding PadR family transcriptional regulator